MLGTKTLRLGEVHYASTRNGNAHDAKVQKPYRLYKGQMQLNLGGSTLDMLHALLAFVFILESVQAGVYVNVKIYKVKS